MDSVAIVVAAVVGLVTGSLANRLIVREPGYVITDPRDLPEDADASLLDELEPEPEDLPAVPVLALFRPGTWWRRWFPVTEVITAAAFAGTVAELGWGAVTAAVLFMEAALITLAAVDFRVYRIPDRINFPAMAAGLGCIVVVSLQQDVPGSILGAAAGGLLYAGFLFVAHVLSPRGMGWGDVKLAWLMGFYLGWLGWEPGSMLHQLVGPLRQVLFGAALGSVLGVLIGGGYAIVRRSTKVVFPYGPSLAAGCILAVVYGV